MRIGFVGCSGYPYQRNATTTRLRAFVTELSLHGVNVVFINRRGESQKIEESNFPSNVAVIEASGSTARPASKWKRRWLAYTSLLREYRILNQIHEKTRFDALHVYTQSYLASLLYLFFGWCKHIPVYLHFVEMRSQIAEKKGFIKRLNDKLLDGKTLKCFDGFIVISSFLEDYIKAIAPSKKILHVPPICDFQSFSDIPKSSQLQPYFLYCGSLAYKEIIDFIIRSWKMVPDKKSHELLIVANGSKEQIQALSQQCMRLPVKILHDLPYAELIALYKGASGLLIPLRPTHQDLARFPQKCCEYIASGGLLISTNLGEIGKYFKHGETALLADQYDERLYSELLQYSINEPEACRSIATKGYIFGKEIFDSSEYREPLFQLFSNQYEKEAKQS